MTAADICARAAELAEAIRELPLLTRIETLNAVKASLHAVSPNTTEPVDNVRWIPLEKVTPNLYNPNAVAKVEMKLLHRSIEADGYTQPIVAIWDDALQKYVIVDGFHRYWVGATALDIQKRTHRHLPIVVIDKPIEDRMASTVRHNRARGKHSIAGMSSLVFSMLDAGMPDEKICNELGMEAEELVRLKHVTGFSKLFESASYARAWESKAMVQARLAAPEVPGRG